MKARSLEIFDSAIPSALPIDVLSGGGQKEAGNAPAGYDQAAMAPGEEARPTEPTSEQVQRASCRETAVIPGSGTGVRDAGEPLASLPPPLGMVRGPRQVVEPTSIETAPVALVRLS